MSQIQLAVYEHFASLATGWLERYRCRPSFQARLAIVGEVVRATCGANPGGKTLDFGAGVGVFSGVASAGSAVVVALDRAPGMQAAGKASTHQLDDLLRDLTLTLGRTASRVSSETLTLSIPPRPSGTSWQYPSWNTLMTPKPPPWRCSTGSTPVVTLPDTKSFARRIESPLNAIAGIASRYVRSQRLIDRQYAALRPQEVDYASVIALLVNRADNTTQRAIPLGLRGIRSRFSAMTMIVCRRRLPQA